MDTMTIRKQATQYAINIAVMLTFIIMAIAPAALAYFSVTYLNHVGGLIPLLGYWYVHDVTKEYFAH